MIVSKIFLFAVLFWLLETAYFGYNFQPCCNTEEWCDSIVKVLVFAGAFRTGYLNGKSK